MPGARLVAFLLLFAGSGFAALVYQVVWMRELGLLFGNTTHAAATTLAVFFLGLAWGGAWFGRRAPALARPLAVFAGLELGIGILSLLPLLVLMPLYEVIFPWLYGVSGGAGVTAAAFRLVLAGLLLLPATFLMGGTLPVLGQALLADRSQLGARGGWLYGANTLGAAAGAFAAAFVLAPALGYRATGLVAFGVGVVVGVAALLLGGRASLAAERPRPAPLGPGLAALAFLSGALALALEVLWTRAFAQVLQNSVFTYGAILVVFLLALALGGGAASLLARSRVAPRTLLGGVLLASGVLVGLGPRVFGWVNADMRALEGYDDFGGYLGTVFRHLSLVLFVPVTVLGVVFPFLLRVSAVGHEADPDAGSVLGRLVAWNTVGALCGSLAAGFALVAWLGPWVSIVLIGGAYVLAAAVVLGARRRPVGLVLVLLLVPIGAEAAQQRIAARDRMVPRGGDGEAKETLLAVYEGAAGTVAVTRKHGTATRRLRYNRYYTLGSSADPRWERIQAHLPLLIHPQARSVFFLGLGTGITAGGAMVHDVERVVVSELVPEVATAARAWFAPQCQGLFDDPRVEIRTEDARTLLRGTREQFDVIVGDLFLPWKRGVGQVFTREQLEAGRARLAPGGLYCQWLPLYQLGQDDFASIVRTFEAAFPRVTLWRGGFFARRPLLALIGHEDRRPLDAAGFAERVALLAGRGHLGFERGAASIGFQLYAGGATPALGLLPEVPLNTDDKPWLELQAPRHQIARRVGEAAAFVGADLATFFEQLLAAEPPERDGYLERATDAQRGYVEAGAVLYRHAVAQDAGDRTTRKQTLDAWRALVPEDVRPRIRDWVR